MKDSPSARWRQDHGCDDGRTARNLGKPNFWIKLITALKRFLGIKS